MCFERKLLTCWLTVHSKGRTNNENSRLHSLHWGQASRATRRESSRLHSPTGLPFRMAASQQNDLPEETSPVCKPWCFSFSQNADPLFPLLPPSTPPGFLARTSLETRTLSPIRPRFLLFLLHSTVTHLPSWETLLSPWLLCRLLYCLFLPSVSTLYFCDQSCYLILMLINVTLPCPGLPCPQTFSFVFGHSPVFLC